MWSHYADAHKGICIQYDFLNKDKIRTFLQPVYYHKYRPTVKALTDIDTYYNVFASICKSPDWSYEKEWRLTFFTEDQIKGAGNFVSVPVPLAIYLGPRFDLNPEDFKSEFYEIIKEKDIPLYRMVVHRSEYRILQGP